MKSLYICKYTHQPAKTMLLYCSIRRARFWKYISYGGARLCNARLKELFPEMEELSKVSLIRRPFGWWQQRLSDHNSVVRRGIELKLSSHSAARRLIFESLDQYILTMSSRKICQVLRCINKFGERVASLVQEQPSAMEWWVNEDVVIHQRHWLALCHSVMHIALLAGNDRRNQEFQSSVRSAIKFFGPSLQLQNTYKGAVLSIPFHSNGDPRRAQASSNQAAKHHVNTRSINVPTRKDQSHPSRSTGRQEKKRQRTSCLRNQPARPS